MTRPYGLLLYLLAGLMLLAQPGQAEPKRERLDKIKSAKTVEELGDLREELTMSQDGGSRDDAREVRRAWRDRRRELSREERETRRSEHARPE